MDVERVKIDSYGPLRDVDHEFDGGLTLLHGANESGKTLYVEAFVKMLLDAEAEGFPDIQRVQGMPAGFVEVDCSDGRLQLPDAGFSEVFPPPATSRDVRDAFVVRDVDLRRPRRSADFGRSSYLRDVTDRVLGARTGEIEQLQEELAELGDLTPSFERLRNQQPRKLKDRVEEARELSADLESYVERCRDDGALEDVQRLRRKRERMQELDEEIAELEIAKEQSKVEDAQALVEELRAVDRRIEEREREREEVEQLRDLRREIDRYRKRLGQQDVDPEVILNAVAVLGLLFALSLLAAVVSPVTGMLVLSGVILAALLYVGQSYLDTRELVGEEDRLVREANYSGVSGSTLPEVYVEVEEEIEGFEAEFDRLRGERERVVGRLQEVFDVDHVDADSWQEEVEEYADSVEDVDRSYTEGELEEARERLKELEHEMEEMEEEVKRHRERLREFDRRVREVSPSDYLDGVDDVGVDSVLDLPVAGCAVEEFVENVEADRDAAQLAIDVLEEMEQKEEEEIDELLGGDGYVRDVFRDVTDGSYVDVWYDGSSGAVKVERADGRELSAAELSQGTYDLLYLAIRLKLARELSGDEPGFLLLDSPFVHSDSDRVDREVRMLEDLAEDGWQILYLSFREVVRDAVEEVDGARVVEMEALDFDS